MVTLVCVYCVDSKKSSVSVRLHCCVSNTVFCVLQYGFLVYEVEEGRKLFFHMSDVIGEEPLHQGDDVEFVIVSQKDGKHSARQLRKIA